MLAGFVLAVMLCNGDNCDMIRAEPGVSYPTYEECAAASASKSGMLNDLVAQYRADKREADIICLRELPRIGSASPPQKEPASSRSSAAPPLRSGEFRDCATCPVMVPLRGGVFTMGSHADPSEKPMHRVKVSPVALGKFVVTEAEWDACVAGGACTYGRPHDAEAGERRPMRNLSWADAEQYVSWLRKVTGKPYRLPTEAEWEYAARAGSNTRFGFGDQVGFGKVNCDGCGGAYDPHRPADVDAFPPNAWGLYGMSGGVAQWVEDCWHPNYRSAPTDGSAWMGGSCAQHVLRGGSWRNPPSDVTVSARNFYDSTVRYPANGVRVALSLG